MSNYFKNLNDKKLRKFCVKSARGATNPAEQAALMYCFIKGEASPNECILKGGKEPVTVRLL